MTTTDPRAAAIEAAAFHRAKDAEERGEGICRTCLAPIWNEGGTVHGARRTKGWSDRIERGGDSLVCFNAVQYRHVPLSGREAVIYDRAYTRGVAAAVPHLTAGLRALHYRESGDESLEGEWCAECGDDWPCSTTQALDALERGGSRG